MSVKSEKVSAENILKESLGEIRFRLNGSITNSQLIYAMESCAIERIKEAVPIILKEVAESKFVRPDLRSSILSLSDGIIERLTKTKS